MKKYRKILIFFAIILIGMTLSSIYDWKSYLKDINNLDKIRLFVEENYSISVVYYLLFTIVASSVLALPGVTFALLSSAIFGPLSGVFYCALGTTIGAVISFLLSRYLLKNFIKKLVRKNKKLYGIVFQENTQREMLILMITRILPIFPFNLQNFAYGITDISIVKYTIGTFLFMLPGIIVFSLTTEALLNQNNRASVLIAALLFIVIIVIIGTYLYKRYKRLVIGESDER